MTWTQIISYGSGLAFVAPDLDKGTLLGTTLVVNLCNAFMCRVIGRNNGHRPWLWFGLGLTGGVWAVAVLSVLPRRVSSGSPGSSK
jgi:ABC-type transport system involved in cytochrome c biogenesis permease subunit